MDYPEKSFGFLHRNHGWVPMATGQITKIYQSIVENIKNIIAENSPHTTISDNEGSGSTLIASHDEATNTTKLRLIVPTNELRSAFDSNGNLELSVQSAVVTTGGWYSLFSSSYMLGNVKTHEFKTLEYDKGIYIDYGVGTLKITTDCFRFLRDGGNVGSYSVFDGNLSSPDDQTIFFNQLRAGANVSLSRDTDTHEIIISATSEGTGTINDGANLGTGEFVFAQKNGDDLEFKSLKAGANMSITADANEITFAASPTGGGGGNVYTAETSSVVNTIPVYSDTSGVNIKNPLINVEISADGLLIPVAKYISVDSIQERTSGGGILLDNQGILVKDKSIKVNQISEIASGNEVTINGKCTISNGGRMTIDEIDHNSTDKLYLGSFGVMVDSSDEGARVRAEQFYGPETDGQHSQFTLGEYLRVLNNRLYVLSGPIELGSTGNMVTSVGPLTAAEALYLDTVPVASGTDATVDVLVRESGQVKRKSMPATAFLSDLTSPLIAQDTLLLNPMLLIKRNFWSGFQFKYRSIVLGSVTSTLDWHTADSSKPYWGKIHADFPSYIEQQTTFVPKVLSMRVDLKKMSNPGDLISDLTTIAAQTNLEDLATALTAWGENHGVLASYRISDIHAQLLENGPKSSNTYLNTAETFVEDWESSQLSQILNTSFDLLLKVGSNIPKVSSAISGLTALTDITGAIDDLIEGDLDTGISWQFNNPITGTFPRVEVTEDDNHVICKSITKYTRLKDGTNMILDPPGFGQTTGTNFFPVDDVLINQGNLSDEFWLERVEAFNSGSKLQVRCYNSTGEAMAHFRNTYAADDMYQTSNFGALGVLYEPKVKGTTSGSPRAQAETIPYLQYKIDVNIPRAPIMDSEAVLVNPEDWNAVFINEVPYAVFYNNQWYKTENLLSLR